ncbi:uncharacterized protein LOC118198458 [Stegodyphus dumicola]|uniref:uncharacterized protein LOC118198458 n=1 Tax=Stegodyphus dumicola TaxID=202533 RepID=UPI0015A7A727|nr:uncharacterized protein LOC118198458 [Stegodyphus dumicola]
MFSCGEQEVETEDGMLFRSACLDKCTTNSVLLRKRKFIGSKNDPTNILNVSLVVKQEVETEDEDAVQVCMPKTNVQTNSVLLRKRKFIGITKEENKVTKNVDEYRSSNWSFSNLNSKNNPANIFNYSVAIKEEIETEDENAVQDYVANTNNEINSDVIKNMKFTSKEFVESLVFFVN